MCVCVCVTWEGHQLLITFVFLSPPCCWTEWWLLGKALGHVPQQRVSSQFCFNDISPACPLIVFYYCWYIIMYYSMCEIKVSNNRYWGLLTSLSRDQYISLIQWELSIYFRVSIGFGDDWQQPVVFRGFWDFISCISSVHPSKSCHWPLLLTEKYVYTHRTDKVLMTWTDKRLKRAHGRRS